MQQPAQTQTLILGQTSTPSQVNTNNQANANFSLYISMLLLVPMVFILSIISYKKYRSSILIRQIKMLERIWLIDASRRTP